MLIKSEQNRLISSKICPENSHEISRFLPIGEVSTENFSEFVSENPMKFDFFSQPIRSPVVWMSIRRFWGKRGKMEVKKGHPSPI